MKLHLPLSLRSSLLTCMAALAAAFTTVASGTAIVGTVVLTAALSATASAEWAPDGITYTGTVSIDAATTETLTVTENSLLTYTYAGLIGPITATNLDIRIAAGATTHMMAGTNVITAKSLWISEGRLDVSSAALDHAGTIYAQGGQMFVAGGQTIKNAISLGSTTYTEGGNAALSAAIRLANNATLSGKISLVEDGAVSVTASTNGKITGAIATNGFAFEKTGAGTLDFSAANSNKFDKLVLNGGVLRSSARGHNTAVAVTALDIKSTTTLAHNGWNSVWTIGALMSSAADSSDFTLTLDQQGTHFFRQTYIFNGTGTVDAGSLYSGLIDVKNTGSGQEGRDGIWRVELQAGTNQLSKAVVNLNNHAIMAVTADQLELKGLTSTNANAYVFSGASTDTERNTGTNNTATPHFVMDGTVRTLTLSGSDDYSFTGTLAGNLVIEKTGAGKQTFGNIGENVTINLHSGSLWLLGTVGEGSTIMTDAGTTVDVPWAITTVGDVATAVYGSPEYIKGEGTINLGTVAGIGDTALSTTDGKYTILDATGYTKSDLRIVSGLLSIFANGTTSPADFGSIETFVLDGGGLVANATNSAETYTFDKNIQVVGNGYVRVYGNETTSANMVVTGSISGSGTLVKTDGGQLTLAGDMSQFKGKVNLGNGTLAFDTNATLAGLTMTDHTKLGVYGGHSVVLTSTAAAPWVPNAGTFTFALEDGGDFSTSRIRFTNATTLNLTTSTHGSITVQGLQMADTGTSRINIGANTTLNIMGTQTAKGQSGGAFNQNTTLLLAHYNADSHIDVEGTLNMLYCGAFGLTDRNATMRVANGAELNLLGLDVVRRTDFINDGKGLNLTFDQGSALHLGAEGIGNATTDYLTSSLKLTFKGGTIGILSSTTSWSTNTALTFTGDVVVDTRYYAAATDGTKGTYSQAGGTINMLGAITGDGKLIKRGEGTLTLTNVANLAVEEGYVGAGHVGGAASGTLTISGTLQAMTEGGGRFLINLGDGGASDQIVAANYGNQRVNLSLVGGSAGTYTVFNGGTGLTDASNIDLALYLNRGLSYDAATGLTIAGGVVQVTLTGEASTENYDLTWAGETNETWSNNTVEAWEGDAGSGNRFSAGDRVIFNGGGLSEVVIDGIVTPGSVTVTGTQDYTISGGKLQGAGALTKEGDATLTLDTDTSGWTGEINLSGGTLAFTGSLGAGNVNLSGTSVLSWLEGNTTDLSSRLKIAADSDVTFSIAGGSKVIFNSAITPLAENETAHFTKAGAGTLMIQGAGALRGDLVVSEGTLEMGGASSNAGAIYGGLTVKSGAKVLVNRGNFTGWLPGQTITRLLLEQDSEIVLGAGSAALTHTIYGGALTMNGATISSTVAGNTFEFTEKAVATIGGSKQSIFQANMVLDYGDTTGTIFNVADATGDENVDFLVTGGVTAHRGNTGLDKQGAGTMEITGKYEAGKITLSGGKLILHGAKLQGDALGVAAGTTLQFAADSSSSWALTSDKTLENGTFLLDRGATLLTNSNNTYHLTLNTGTVLAGEGTLIVGTPTNSTQTNGDRRLILNGSTAGFTGYVDVQASAGNTGAYRGTLILNSADAAFGGVVRTQGVTFGSPATADDAVVPEMAGIIVQKSMSVGGFDGKGGMLTTDVADGQRITLTLGRDDNHAFGGSVGANIDLVKTGTGKQVFSGNLSAYNGTTTVQQGTLDLGAVELKNNIALTGTGASLTAGMVTLTEAGKTLTISATGTVLSADVRLRDMTISLGSNSLDLAGHKLSLSGYAKCNLSLTLGDDLQAGDTIDLFTGAKVSVAGPDNIGMEITNKTVKVTDLFNTDDPWLQDAIVYFDPATSKLQIILSRGTGSLVYGRGDNGVWATGEFFEAGENGAVFEADQNVSFNTLEGTDTTMTVQIKGALSVGAAYVDAGAGNTYRFEQHADLGSIAALKSMTIAGGTASFATGTLAPAEGATITVKGATLALDNGATNDNVSLALTDGATLKWNTGNTTDYAAGNRLSIADGANVTLDVNGNRVVLGQGTGSGATGSGGHITLADTATGGSLVLGGSSALHGTLDLGGQTLRLDAGDHYDLKLTGNGNLVARGEVTLTAANDFAGTLTIGDNTDATGNNGSADTPVNGTLNVTDASLGSGVTGIALVANGDGIGSTLNYAAGADATLAAAITGTGDVNITGGHIVTLTGANTYAGKTGIGADTTLKVTDTSLSSATEIGNAGGAGGTLHLTNTRTNGALDFANKVGENVSVTVSGGTINWLTGNDEAKTYTGTTTIAAHTTVTAAGPLTTGENSQIVLEGEDSVLNLDFSSRFAANNWTKGHTVSGAGKLAINAAGQTLAAGDVLTSLMTSEKALGTLALTSGILDVTSSQNATYLKKITLLEVADGAQLAVRSPGMQDNQAGLKLSLAGAGTGGAGSDTAAALFFGKRGSDSVAIGNVARDVTLAADATVYVEDTVTGTLAGAYASNGHTLTKTGDGTLQLNHLDTSGNNFAVEAGVLQYQGDADNTFASVTLKAGTALSFYNNVAPQHTQTVEQLSLLGDATLRAEWNSSIWKITSLLGEDKTLTIDAASASTVQQHFVIDGGAFSGQINVQQGAAAPERERHAIVTINDATALQGAIVNLLAPANDLSTVSFGVGGSADGTISIAGLNGVAGTDLVSSSAISGESAAPAPDGNSRTLEITGSGTDYAFAGSVGAHLTVAMNGAGTQTLSGALADGTHYLAKAGTLKIASASQTGSHRFTAQGGTLDMGGYTRANDAAGADSIVYESGTISNLTLGSGMELGAAESYTGAIRLGGTTVLAGGTMSFRLTNTHPTYEDLATSYTIANGGSISLAGNGSTTMLTFIPVNKKLDPTTDENGKDYTLIANVGDTFGAVGEVDKDALGLDFNMSTSGRTHYTLKVVENDDGTKSLVLNVQGAAAELTWKGTSSSWNTAPDNLAWNNGTGDASFLDDDYVIFGSLGSAQIIQIDEAGARMGGMVVVGDTDYTFNGGAITSSSGVDTATLTIGTVEGTDDMGQTVPGQEFTGTLTLNTENSYAGGTTLNSGTVIAGTARALSTTALEINGGTLSLNFEGTLATSGVTMNGGTLNASADASVTNLTVAGTTTGKTFSADANHTLTLASAKGTLEGALTIGSAEKTGTVILDIATSSLSTAQNIAVLGGELNLDGTTGNFSGADIALTGGNLHVTGGLVATFASITGNGGKVIVDGSTLAFSNTAATSIAAQIDAADATVQAGGPLALQNLHLVSGTTTLAGAVVLEGITEGSDTTLAIGKSGGTAGTVTLGAGVTSLANVSLANGTLTVKDGDSLTFLESWGTLTSADKAGVTIGAAFLKNGATVDSGLTVTFTGSDTLTGEKAKSWLGNTDDGAQTTLGDVIVDGALADVNLGGRAVVNSLLIKEGKVTTHYDSNTVTQGITLAGTHATLDLHGAAPATTITLQQGALANAGNYAGTITLKEAQAGTAFTMGGLTDKATVSLVQFATGSSLTNLGSLKLGDSTIRVTSNMQPIFVMNDAATGTVSIADGATISIVCGSIIQDVLKNNTGSYALTNGSLSGLVDGGKFKDGIIFDPTLGLYNVGASIDGGKLVFTVLDPENNPDAVFRSSEDGTTVDSYAAMDGIAKVDIDQNTTIDLTGATVPGTQTEDGLLIKNLHNTGSEATTLTIRGDGNDLVTLNNNLASTWYNGDIVLDQAGLQVRHTDALGDGSDPSERELTILGSLSGTGELILTDGRLTVNGSKSDLDGGITFNDDPAAGEKGLLTLNGDTALGGTVQGGGGTSADIIVGKGATVTLKDGADFRAWMTGSNAETLALADNATVTLGEDAHIEGLGLELGKGSTATIRTSGDNLSFNGLEGTGSLAGAADARLGLDLQKGTTALFNGDMSAWEGTLAVSGEGMQVLASAAPGAKLDVQNGNLTLQNSGKEDSSLDYGDATLKGGSLHFDTRTTGESGILANSHIGLTSLTVEPPAGRADALGNALVFDMNLTNNLATGNNALVTVAGGNAHLAAGTTVTVNVHGIAEDFTFKPGETMSFTLLDGLDGSLTDASQLTFTGSTSLLKKYFGDVSLTIDGNRLQLTGTAITADEMHYHRDAASTETGRTGGALMDYLFITTNPQGTAPGSLAADVLTSLEDIIDNGKPNADRVLSSIAGSTVTALGSSFAAGLETQMTSIRNRMTGMGVDDTYVNEDMPYFHAWISANAGDTRLDADNTLAGYKLTTTGGTVGVDADVSDHLTLGASFTASYGDLTADGAEMADGHLDTYTAAIFARAQVHNWAHNLVLAVSTADADLDRTVDYGAGSYKTKGTSNGIAFGALYETTFDIHVGEDGEDLFQPLFRASFTHASMDGYSETGAEAMGLHVGKQDITYATFGLGARYIAGIGENVFNRTATFELRAMILQDAGSRRGEADVALGGTPGRTYTVRGAEPGSTGVQVGASLNIPVEESSAIFADVNLDARAKATSLNGSVGYRIDF